MRKKFLTPTIDVVEIDTDHVFTASLDEGIVEDTDTTVAGDKFY